MWVGSIRLRVQTKDANNAGTDSLVTAMIVRNGVDILNLKLDYPTENDLERGAVRNYDYFGLARRNDQTPELPPGVGQDPMPYPPYGIEFSNGMPNHFKLRLRIHGEDMWIKDRVEVFIREIRLKSTSFDTLAWQEDSNFVSIGTWGVDTAMSTDSDEGVTQHTLNLP